MNTTLFIEILAHDSCSNNRVVAYLLFNAHFKDQQNTRRWLIQKRIKTALPYDCKAYERLTLLMERINPSIS
jgi:hypothetical protein